MPEEVKLPERVLSTLEISLLQRLNDQDFELFKLRAMLHKIQQILVEFKDA